MDDCDAPDLRALVWVRNLSVREDSWWGDGCIARSSFRNGTAIHSVDVVSSVLLKYSASHSLLIRFLTISLALNS